MAGQAPGGQRTQPNTLNQGKYVGNPNQGNPLPPPILSKKGQGFGGAATPEYLKNFKGLNGQAGTADSRMYTLDGKQQFGSSSYISALTKHLESIGQGNLLKGGTYTPQATAPSQQPTTSAVNRPNINVLAAEGIQRAGLGAAEGMGFKPLQVNANQLSNTDLSPYMNKYTDDVIKANEADILRGANIGLDNLGAQAQMANAFGGSRHGVAMGEMGRGVAQQLAQSSAGLRQAGFQNAQNMAQYDIGNNFQSQMANQGADMQGAQQRLGAANQLGQTANLGFNMGQTVNNNLAMQGAQQQAMQQALFDAAKQQFQGYSNQGANTLGYVNQALGQTPNVGTVSTQETKQNGLFDYLTAMSNSYTGGK